MNTHIKQLSTLLCGGLLVAAITGCDKRDGEQRADATTTTTVPSQTVPPSDTATTPSSTSGAVATAGTQVGQTIDDATITAAVKAEYIKDKEIDALKINVDTKDGVVTLNGTAPNEPARTKAESVALAVKGVARVNNNLTVKPVG